MSLICGIAGPRLDAKRLWHDGLNWRSICVRCGAPMLREISTREWRMLRPLDHDERRYANPGSDT